MPPARPRRLRQGGRLRRAEPRAALGSVPPHEVELEPGRGFPARRATRRSAPSRLCAAPPSPPVEGGGAGSAAASPLTSLSDPGRRRRRRGTGGPGGEAPEMSAKMAAPARAGECA